MRQDLQRLLATVQNPFVHTRVDNAWDPVFDVPEINAQAYETCLRVLADVRDTHLSHGAILHGQPGTGKTHLLARLRQRVLQGEQAWFVYVLPLTTPERFFRHVLQALSADVLRAATSEGGVPQVAVALARRILRDPGAGPDKVNQFWLTTRREQADLLVHLRERTAPLVEELELEPDIFDVVLQFVAGRHRSEARAWLLGRSVTEAQASYLGVARALDEEESARHAFRTLLKVAGPDLPVAMAFDQIEGLQRDPNDQQSLLEFGNGVAALLAESQNLAIITCCLTDFLGPLRTALGPARYTGRLAERLGGLHMLGTDDAIRLVERRLAESTDLQTVRKWGAAHGHRECGENLWPLSSSQLRVLLVNPLAARELLTDCRELFQAAAEVSESAPSTERAPEPGVVPSLNPLARLWDDAVEEERLVPRAVLDEGVYADGLVRAIDALVPAAEVKQSPEPDIDFAVESAGKRHAVAVCHAENMRSLSARLRRLHARQSRNTSERLVVLRDERLRISPTAHATRRHLDDIVESQGAFERPSSEAYDALAALRRLMSEAAAGDLCVEGRTIAPQELKDWLASETPPVLRDLVGTVLGDAREAEDPAAERLFETLREEWVLTLDVAADRSGLGVEETRRAALEQPTLIGYIHGSPDILFLRPEALEHG